MLEEKKRASENKADNARLGRQASPHHHIHVSDEDEQFERRLKAAVSRIQAGGESTALEDCHPYSHTFIFELEC